MADFRIDTNKDLRLLQERFHKFGVSDLQRASRHAINRTLLTLRGEAVSKTTKILNVKPSVMRDPQRRHMKIRKARSIDGLESMEGVISFNDKQIPLIEFVKGSRQPMSQKGIAVRKRKKLRVMVLRGRLTTLPRAFIQNGKNGPQVFRRREGGKFKNLYGLSVGHVVEKRGVAKELQVIGGRRYLDLFLAYLTRYSFKG